VRTFINVGYSISLLCSALQKKYFTSIGRGPSSLLDALQKESKRDSSLEKKEKNKKLNGNPEGGREARSRGGGAVGVGVVRAWARARARAVGSAVGEGFVLLLAPVDPYPRRSNLIANFREDAK